MNGGKTSFSFTTKSKYGVSLIVAIALCGKTVPRKLLETAGATTIPLNYLSILVVKLRKAGFISSTLGAGGGYLLARHPKDITLLDIVEVMDDPMHLVACSKNIKDCPLYKTCLLYPT